MSNVLITGRGTAEIPNHYGFGSLGNTKVSMAQNGSLFNTDGSKNEKAEVKNIGGNNMSNMWTTTGGQVGINNGNNGGVTPQTGWQIGNDGTTATNGQVQGFDTSTPTSGGFNVGGQATQNNGTTMGNWGDVQPTQQVVTGNGQYDKVAAGKEAIKKLAGKLLTLVQTMNAEEFNEFVKIFDMADIKDEFLARSGRQDSYLDRQLLTEALNEANMVFTENNQKNINLTNQLSGMANTLNNTGAYDAGNVYRFLIDCVNAGAIPASIANDPMRQHLNRVIGMAMNFRNNGGVSGIGASGANWGTAQSQANNWIANATAGWGQAANTGNTWGATNWNTNTQSYGGNTWGNTNVNTSNWGATANNDWVSGPTQQGQATWGNTQMNTQPWGGVQSGGAAPVQTYSTRVNGGQAQGNMGYNNDPWGGQQTQTYGQPSYNQPATGGGYNWSAMVTQAQQNTAQAYNPNTYGQSYDRVGSTNVYL